MTRIQIRWKFRVHAMGEVYTAMSVVAQSFEETLRRWRGLIDQIDAVIAAHPGMQCHHARYETTAFRQLTRQLAQFVRSPSERSGTYCGSQ
jgi:hypothetical protein